MLIYFCFLKLFILWPPLPSNTFHLSVHLAMISKGGIFYVLRGFWVNYPFNTGRKHTNLCQGRFVDAVNIRFGLRFNLVSQRLVADCTVYQRLHGRTNRTAQVRTGIQTRLPDNTWNSLCRFSGDTLWSPPFLLDKWWLWGRSGGRWISLQNQAERKRTCFNNKCVFKGFWLWKGCTLPECLTWRDSWGRQNDVGFQHESGASPEPGPLLACMTRADCRNYSPVHWRSWTELQGWGGAAATTQPSSSACVRVCVCVLHWGADGVKAHPLWAEVPNRTGHPLLCWATQQQQFLCKVYLCLSVQIYSNATDTNTFRRKILSAGVRKRQIIWLLIWPKNTTFMQMTSVFRGSNWHNHKYKSSFSYLDAVNEVWSPQTSPNYGFLSGDVCRTFSAAAFSC